MGKMYEKGKSARECKATRMKSSKGEGVTGVRASGALSEGKCEVLC